MPNSNIVDTNILLRKYHISQYLIPTLRIHICYFIQRHGHHRLWEISTVSWRKRILKIQQYHFLYLLLKFHSVVWIFCPPSSLDIFTSCLLCKTGENFSSSDKRSHSFLWFPVNILQATFRLHTIHTYVYSTLP